MYKEEIEIDGIKYILKIHVEKRNNVRASLRNRNINIRVPAGIGKKRREKYISQTLENVRKSIRENPDLKPKPKVLRKYHDGQTLTVGRDEYLLSIKSNNTKTSTAQIYGNTIRISLAAGLNEEKEHRHLSTIISRSIAKKKQPEMEALLRELNEKHFKQELKSVRLKNNKTNWGSCSKRGNINLSTRLLFAPDDIIEYVCIHELAHLIELNHSARFWELVERAAPDHKEKRKWLKQNCREFYF